MENHRRIKKRNLSSSEKEFIAFVDSLFLANEWGFLQFPRFMWHYRGCVMAAYQGNLEPIAEMITRVGKRTKLVELKVDDSPIAIKYKGGLAGAYLNVVQLLRAYQEMLTEYWRLENAAINSCRKESVRFACEQYNEILRRERERSINNRIEATRERL